MKDLMVLHEFGIPAIAPCSENLFMSQKSYDKLKSKFKTIFLLYDLDSAGIRASKKIKLEFPDIRVLLLPRSKGCKDCSDFIKKHGKQEFLKLINELKEKFGFS
jgi:DNA primase